jgi:ketosteroid isomerase-like protein
MTTKTRTSISKSAILDLERQYWEAVKAHDSRAATELTDDTCIVVGPQGVMEVDKDELAGMMEDASFELEEFALNDKKAAFRKIGDDVAILSYAVHERMTRDGKPETLDAYDSSVWVRRNGGWVCALHTETRAASNGARMT